MDPLSVLGAVAASAQFVEQGMKLATFLRGLYSQMKDAPESIRRQIIQIEQLLSLSRLFLQNLSLQKDSVASILGNCILRARELEVILKDLSVTGTDGRFKRLKKKFETVMRQADIVALFDKLECDKSSLILSMQEIDSKLLCTINITVESTKNEVGNVLLVVNDTAHNLKTVTNILPEISTKLTDLHERVPGMADNVEKLLSLTLDHQASGSFSQPPNCSRNYYMVPNRRARGFLGRENVLARIETGFTSNSAPRIVVVRGLGGQGKTQVALEYCHRARKKGIKAIFWVDATSERSVKTSLETISESIKSPGQTLQDEARVGFVMENLVEWPEPWIMVFDNHDNPSAFNLQDFMPNGEHGCMLVTSRHGDTDSLTDPDYVIELQGLPEKDSLDILFKQSQVKATESNIQHGKFIVERLGYHPLAITQAASYIKLRKIELNNFMDYYNQRRQDILQQTPQMSQYRRKLSDEARETSLNVFTTWELSFQQLQETDGEGKEKENLMTLFAFFDCKDVSELLLETFCNTRDKDSRLNDVGRSLNSCLNAQGRWSQDRFIGFLSAIAQISLVQSWSRDESSVCHLSLHPLIKDWIRLRTNITAFQDYTIVAAEILGTFLKSCFRQFEFSVSNQQAVLAHIDSYKENFDLLRTELRKDAFDAIYRNLSFVEPWFLCIFVGSGQFDEAEAIAQRLATWYEENYGLDYDDTLHSHHTLAIVLSQNGKFEEADEIYRRVQDRKMKIFGAEHPSSLASRRDLAQNLMMLNQYPEAENLLRQVLSGQEKVLGGEHPDTLKTLSDLSSCLRMQQHYDEAGVLVRQALSGTERLLGPKHLVTLRTVWELAFLHEDQQQYDDALAYYQRACSGLKKVLGEDHPETIKCIKCYSDFLKKVGAQKSEPVNPVEPSSDTL